MESMKRSRNHFAERGWVVLKPKGLDYLARFAVESFYSIYRARFGGNTDTNRQLIKRFSDSPQVSRLFDNKELISMVSNVASITNITFCGPVVSHYVSNDATGSGHGVPLHQDFPSMASSLNSAICWIPLTDIECGTHSISILDGMHQSGLLPGRQTASGYIINNDYMISSQKMTCPQVAVGELLLMSSFLPHFTNVEPNATPFRLALSRRVDDINCDDWKIRGYGNAYTTEVDRKLFES